MATNTSKGNINSLSNLLLKSSGICYASKNNAIAMIRANGDFFANLSLLFLIYKFKNFVKNILTKTHPTAESIVAQTALISAIATASTL